MFGVIGAQAVSKCNTQWGFLTIILAYLAFLCFWMVFKKRKELDIVTGIAGAVYFAIYFILSFFAKCSVCIVFMGVGLLILGIVFGYYLYTEKSKRKVKLYELIVFLALCALLLASFIVTAVVLLPVAMIFIAISILVICVFVGYLIYILLCQPIKCKKDSKQVTAVKEEEVKEEVEPEEVPVESEVEETPVEAEPEEVVATSDEGASLKESFSIMDALVSQSRVTKASIIAYLSGTYGDKVILNSRPNRTKNDRLPMADTHYAIVGGKKICFIYVYQNNAGGVLLLIKTNKNHYNMIAEKHAGVKRSAFPRRGEWYSIVVDDTYAEEEIYKIISDAYEITLNDSFKPTDWIVNEVVATAVEDEGASLKESLSIMDALSSHSNVSKASIITYLSGAYGDKVILNSRPNRTKNDRLPMADTHYAIVDGKKICFIYVYQNNAGGVLLLIKTNHDHYAKIAEKHESVKRSAFPRRGEWYSIVVDETYTEEEINKIISEVYEITCNK